MKKSCLNRRICAFVFPIFFAIAPIYSILAQEVDRDSLEIKYRLIENYYSQYEDIVKIKLPPYLSTREVMEQVKLSVQWPGDPPPSKRTRIYVFRDDAVIGDKSATGAMYFPGKGFRWDLTDWLPDLSIYTYRPGSVDKMIYNTVLDTFFSAEMFASEYSTAPEAGSKMIRNKKKNVASLFDITTTEMDSIYFRVKWWLELNPQARVQPKP